MEVISRILRLSALLLAIAPILSAQITTFGVHVRTKAKPKDRNLSSLRGHLHWDDTARELRIERDISFSLKEAVTKIPYGEVSSIRFDPLTNPLRRSLVVRLVDPASPTAEDSYVHIHLANGGAHLLEIDDEDVLVVAAKARDVFGAKVIEDPVRRAEKTAAKDLPERSAHFSLKVLKTHPSPILVPGKALVWVLSPAIASTGFYGMKSPMMRLHANGTIVAVTRQGTYSYAQLDPGVYNLVSQVGDHASGFQRTLEAGKEYFLYQNEALRYSVILSEQSREVARYELTGLEFGEWKKR